MLAETLHFLQVIYVFTLSSLFPSSLREDVPASCLTQQSPICHLCCSETSRQGRQWPFQFSYSLQVQWASLSSCFSIPFYSKIPRVCWSALAPPSPSQLTFVRPKSPSLLPFSPPSWATTPCFPPLEPPRPPHLPQTCRIPSVGRTSTPSLDPHGPPPSLRLLLTGFILF